MIEAIIAGSLATWRLSSLMMEEEGPFDILTTTREWLCARFDLFDRLLSCFWCTSVWAAAFISVLLCLITRGNVITWIIYTLATSCGAILADGFLQKGNETWPGQIQKPS
jgi:hypothetical protein